MLILKASNLGMRFVLELCALAALGYWGFKTGHGIFLKVILGLGAPLAAATIWECSDLRQHPSKLVSQLDYY
jgi:hypothetical protein